MARDFKKEDKELYCALAEPTLVKVGAMNFLMVDGKGDPNTNPQFQTAVEALYGLSYTIRMMPKSGLTPPGYFEYVVPPLEGLWWVGEGEEFSFQNRDNWCWTLMIRQPDFVTNQLIHAAENIVHQRKKQLKIEAVRFETFTEGLCVQILHLGPYSTEPKTQALLDAFMVKSGLRPTFAQGGKHHEIYLSDPRRTAQEKLKTILRQPVAKVAE